MARRQLLLGLLLAGLALVLTVVGLRGPEPSRRDGDTVLWSFRRADVDRLDVVRGEQHVRLVKGGEGWSMDGAPDEGHAPELVDALDEASRGLRVDVAPGDVGLDGSTRVRFAVGEVEHVVEVGDRAPVGGRVYVRLPGGPVIAVYGGLDEAVDEVLAP